MKLSVVIVNYNVKYFIEQCLHSVARAIENLDVEVFVVDNNSVDGSCQLIRDKFPWVRLIENKDNVGFSRANNQAIRQSTGEYVLLLNPDTVVPETCFAEVLDFMDSHPDAGGLGIKMIDGKGNFLPESKRGVPTPMVAFYKIFGLSKLFPKSKIFGKYHLGYLDKDAINEIEIMSGAFMLMRRTALDKVGLLDEEYFMYGEDIDLSYRILKGGYKNYYYPYSPIIHYKGESTKKGSINYVIVFYKAMVIFARKQLDVRNAKLLAAMINLAIYFRASLSIIKRFCSKLLLPVLDAATIFAGFWLALPFWIDYRFGVDDTFPHTDTYLFVIVPIYLLIWIVAIYLSGGYERPFKLKNVFWGIFIGFIGVVLFYGLLSADYRFSRIMLFVGLAWSLVAVPLVRYLLHLSKIGDFRLQLNKTKRVVLVGEPDEIERIRNIMNETGFRSNIVGTVSLSSTADDANLGTISQVSEIINIHHINEVVFCLKNISVTNIIGQMLTLSKQKVDFKIAPPESVSIIGSNSINTAGEIYTMEINSIAKSLNRQKKRIVDILASLLLLVTLPIMIFIEKQPLQYVCNVFSVLIGRKSWVGYNTSVSISELPPIKKSVLSPIVSNLNNAELITQSNILYAKNYSPLTDIMIMIQNIRNLGNSKMQ